MTPEQENWPSPSALVRWNPLGSWKMMALLLLSTSQSQPHLHPSPLPWLAQEPLQVSSENPASLQVMPRWGINSVREKVRWWRASNLQFCCLDPGELRPGMEQHRVPQQLALLSPSVTLSRGGPIWLCTGKEEKNPGLWSLSARQTSGL